MTGHSFAGVDNRIHSNTLAVNLYYKFVMSKPAVAMEMLSGRIPADLYAWFASLDVEGAVTSSDKLRVLLAQLRRQHEGTMDYVSAMAWFRDLMARTRHDLATIDRDSGAHSEVVATLLEQACALAATALSSHPQSKREAQAMEDQLVRRALLMSEGLLRQAVTPAASAYDPKVVRRQIGSVADLARLISTTSNPAEGGPHG